MDIIDYFNDVNISNISGFFFAMSYSLLHIFLIGEYFLTYDIKKEYIELEKNERLKSDEIQKLKLINDRLQLELKKTKILLLKDKKKEPEPELDPEKESRNMSECGNGPLRYKVVGDKTIYYHGIGHLEKDYAWWKPTLKHSIIEYKEDNIKDPKPWKTTNISEFCSNCSKSEILNKRTRVKVYYICNGHVIEK